MTLRLAHSGTPMAGTVRPRRVSEPRSAIRVHPSHAHRDPSVPRPYMLTDLELSVILTLLDGSPSQTVRDLANDLRVQANHPNRGA